MIIIFILKVLLVSLYSSVYLSVCLSRSVLVYFGPASVKCCRAPSNRLTSQISRQLRVSSSMSTVSHQPVSVYVIIINQRLTWHLVQKLQGHVT